MKTMKSFKGKQIVMEDIKSNLNEGLLVRNLYTDMNESTLGIVGSFIHQFILFFWGYNLICT